MPNERLTTAVIGNLFLADMLLLSYLSVREYGLVGFWIYPLAAFAGALIGVLLDIFLIRRGIHA